MITFIALSFHQQQRIYHSPNPISPNARENHQNDDGRIRYKRMTSPAITAVRPQGRRLPLRKIIAPRAVNSSQHMREALPIFAFLIKYLYIPRICAGC